MPIEANNMAHIRVSLVISDYSNDPEELSERLHIKPTRTYRKGEPIARGAWVTHKSNGWVLESPGMATGEAFEEQVWMLLAVLDEAAPVLQTIAREACVRVYARFDERGLFSGIRLDPRMMEAVCRIGATVEFDVAG